VEATLTRGRRRVCQSSISDGKEDGRKRGGFLYSDRPSTVEKGAVMSQLGRWEERGVGGAVTEQRDKDQEGGGRGKEGGRTSEHLRRPTRVTAADAFPNAK